MNAWSDAWAAADRPQGSALGTHSILQQADKGFTSRRCTGIWQRCWAHPRIQGSQAGSREKTGHLDLPSPPALLPEKGFGWGVTSSHTSPATGEGQGETWRAGTEAGGFHGASAAPCSEYVQGLPCLSVGHGVHETSAWLQPCLILPCRFSLCRGRGT